MFNSYYIQNVKCDCKKEQKGDKVKEVTKMKTCDGKKKGTVLYYLVK